VLVDWTPDGDTRTVSLLRETLLDYPALTGAISDAEPEQLADVRAAIQDVWDAYQASRFGYTTTRLPRVIAGARRLIVTAGDDEQRRDGQRMLALAYHAAAATLTKVGEADLAWIASDRGLNAAEAGQDTAVMASLLRSVAHALLSNGRYSAATDVVSRATDRLDRETLDDQALRWSLLGSLHLVGAMAAARADSAAEARTFLARARQAAQQLATTRTTGGRRSVPRASPSTTCRWLSTSSSPRNATPPNRSATTTSPASWCWDGCAGPASPGPSWLPWPSGCASPEP
jgi:hypothetical protein